ncbi:MAG: hypothetical protein NTX49_07810 [Chlamydiae bacterium]|nr:hypothetical protein [Chlamydiota bacterium]
MPSTKDTFISRQIFHMQEILADSYERFSSTEDPDGTLLHKGVWYATEFYKACKRLSNLPLASSSVDLGSTYHGHGPQEVVTHIEDATSPTGRHLYAFSLKEGIRASKAMLHLKEGLSFLDCGNVCYLASYFALLDLLGEEKFDILFGFDSPFRWTLTADSQSPLSVLFPRCFLQNKSQIQLGDIAYFSNCKQYVVKHIASQARGIHLLCASDSPHKYLVFGLVPKPIYQAEVEYMLYECFNEEPIDDDFYPPHVWKQIYTKSLLCDEEKNRQLVSSYRNRTMSWEEFQVAPSRLEGKLPVEGKVGLWVYRPSMGRIEELLRAPTNKVREVFSSFLIP